MNEELSSDCRFPPAYSILSSAVSDDMRYVRASGSNEWAEQPRKGLTRKTEKDEEAAERVGQCV